MWWYTVNTQYLKNNVLWMHTLSNTLYRENILYCAPQHGSYDRNITTHMATSKFSITFHQSFNSENTELWYLNNQTTSFYVWGHNRYTSLYTWHAKVHKLQVKWLFKILCVVSPILSASCLIIAYQYSSKHTLFT